MATKRKHPTKPRTRTTSAKPRPQRQAGPLVGFSARERRELERIFESVLHGAAFDLTDELSPLDVQAWASSVCGVWYGRRLIDRDTDDVFAGGLVEFAARGGGVVAVRILRALGSVMPGPHGVRARETAGRLVAGGVPDAAWAGAIVAPTVPTGAVIHADPIDDDGVTVIVEFAGALGTHIVGVYIDRNMGGIAKDAFAGPSTLDEIVTKMREQIEADESGTTISPIPLEEAAARISEAFDWTDRTLDPPVSDDLRQAHALVRARLADMPPPKPPAEPRPMTERRRDALFAEFARSRFAVGLDPEHVDDLAHQILHYSLDYAGGIPLRFSPVMVELFCYDWAPRKIVGEARDFESLPDVLRAWIRFVGDRRGIPARRIEAALVAVAEYEDELTATATDPGSWGPAKMLVQAMQAHGVDMADPHAMQGFVDKVNAGEVEMGV